MNRISLSLVAVLVTVLAAPALLVVPGVGPRTASSGDLAAQIRVQVNLVSLFATVRDKKTKKIVSTLEQGDFKVSEDNVEQKLNSFSRENNLPITLGLLI